MSVSELPVEILERILRLVNKTDLYNIGLVSRTFREALHPQAVVKIRGLVSDKIVETKHLARVGWIEGSHSSKECSCVDIAFRYKPFGAEFIKPRTPNPYLKDAQQMIGLVVYDDGIYFAAEKNGDETVGEENGRGVAFNSAESEKMILIALQRGFEQPSMPLRKEIVVQRAWSSFDLYVAGFTLVNVVAKASGRFFEAVFSKPTEFKVTVYDRRTLEPCYILDFTEHLPRGMGGEFCSITGVAITKSTLVIHFGHQIDVEEIKTLVYKIDADRPDVRAEYLLTIKSAPDERNPSERNLEVCATQSVCLNDKFLVAQYSYSIEEDSFEFELGSAIAIYRMDSLNSKPKYLKYIHAEKNMVADYSTMIEAGSSPFLVSWSSNAGKSSIILLNLETKQQLLHVRLSGDHVPSNWCGGVFNFAKLVENAVCFRILDPRTIAAPPPSLEDPLGCQEDASETFFPGKKMETSEKIASEEISHILSDFIGVSIF